METNWILIGAAILIIIILLIFGTIFLVRRFFVPASPATEPTATPSPVLTLSPTPTFTPTPTPTLTPTPTPTFTPTPSPTPRIISLSTRVFIGAGLTLSYPAGWGILTCSNSENFEFDPDNNINQLGAICNFAQKPITVLVSNDLSGCVGEIVNIGGIPTIRNTSVTPNFTLHQWCTETSPVLKISHRVSSIPQRAVSPVDHSAEIETMISTINFATA